MGELISWMSEDTTVFFHSWKNAWAGYDGEKHPVTLRVWSRHLGVHLTVSGRDEVARNLLKIRAATGMKFKKV